MKTLVILAGGNSSRMGTDKTFLNYRGQSFLMHILNRAYREFGRILISAGSESHAQAILNHIQDADTLHREIQPEILRDHIPETDADALSQRIQPEILRDHIPETDADALSGKIPVKIIPDHYEKIGPVGGLLTVFEAVDVEEFALTAVDLPDADMRVLSALLDHLDQSDRAAVMLSLRPGTSEACAAAYRRSAYDCFLKAHSLGVHSIFRALGEERIEILPFEKLKGSNPAFAELDPVTAFRNINTPEDFRSC